MCLQVINRNQWFIFNQGNRFCSSQSDYDPADQSRSGGCRDPVDCVIIAAGLPHGTGDYVIEGFDMDTCRDFRYDPDERGMLADLGQHHIGEDIAAAVLKAFDNRRGSLIARSFDGQDGGYHRPLSMTVVPGTPASSSANRDT